MDATNELRILFFIPVWQRLQITEVCYKGLKRIIEHVGERAQCDVLIVQSEDEHEELAKRYGFKSTHVNNHPLGDKFNKGMIAALKLKWDYVVQLNSDDLLSNDLIDLFIGLMNEGHKFASIEKLYIYDTKTHEAQEFHYTLNGCGIRMISREAIELAGWQQYCEVKQSRQGTYIRHRAGENKYLPAVMANKTFINPLSARIVFRLWEPGINKGLDNNSRNTIFAVIGEPVGWIRGVNSKPMVIDLKSDINIWKYDQLQGRELTRSEVATLPKEFPELRDITSCVGVVGQEKKKKGGIPHLIPIRVL